MLKTGDKSTLEKYSLVEFIDRNWPHFEALLIVISGGLSIPPYNCIELVVAYLLTNNQVSTAIENHLSKNGLLIYVRDFTTNIQVLAILHPIARYCCHKALADPQFEQKRIDETKILAAKERIRQPLSQLPKRAEVSAPYR